MGKYRKSIKHIGILNAFWGSIRKLYSEKRDTRHLLIAFQGEGILYIRSGQFIDHTEDISVIQEPSFSGFGW